MAGWNDMFLAAEAQLDFHPTVPALRDICHYEGHYGNRSGASIFIARPGQSTTWPAVAK